MFKSIAKDSWRSDRGEIFFADPFGKCPFFHSYPSFFLAISLRHKGDAYSPIMFKSNQN